MEAADAVHQYLAEVTALASSLFYYYFPAAAVIACSADVATTIAVADVILAGSLFFFCYSADAAITATIAADVAVAANQTPHTLCFLGGLPKGSSSFCNSYLLFCI